MGHYDNLLITDAGFPIPKNIPCVDLSIRGNIPTVIEIAELLSIELEVEEFFIANEVEAHFRNRKEAINIYFPEAKGHLLPHSVCKCDPKFWRYLLGGRRIDVIRIISYCTYSR
jgi:D-ribose pyranase